MTQYPAITISRSLGSGGTKVGFLIARQLGWHFCDRRILRLAARTLGLSTSSLDWREERPSGILQELYAVLAMGCPESSYLPLVEPPIYSEELFAVERKVILDMVQHAPSVIVGRGGFLALRDRAETLHLRIHSGLPFRIQSLVSRGKAADPESARAAILDSDRVRAAAVRAVSGVDLQDPKAFDLVLDVAADGAEACAKRIVVEFQRRFAGVL